MRFLVTQQYNITPEELLVIAIFRQAASDLCCEFAKWRRDARDFLKYEGFTDDDLRRIRDVWSYGKE